MRGTLLRIAGKRSVCWLNEKLSTRAASLSAGLQAEISTALDGRVSTNQTILNSHGKDESWHPVMAPDLVAFPETTEEVSKVHYSSSLQILGYHSTSIAIFFSRYRLFPADAHRWSRHVQEHEPPSFLSAQGHPSRATLQHYMEGSALTCLK